jgi:hypothetical protein
MALTKLMGQNFRAFVGSVPVLEATSCQCTIQGNLEDATTKDSPSGYNMDQMTSKQWSVQVDGVDATLANLRALITRFNSDAKTTVGWDKTSGENNYVSDNADFSRTGSAILNDLSIQANNRQTIQVSCQYQGSGTLA